MSLTIAAPVTSIDHAALAARIRSLAHAMGFQRCGISDVALGEDEAHLRDWLAQGLHGSMDWMARHGDKRARPQELLPGTVRVISVGLDYGRDPDEAWRTLSDSGRAYVDLSHEVMAAHTGGASNELLTVYTIVDALTSNLPAISMVQILVDGKQVETLAGHVDLRRPIARNLTWVQ